MAGAFGYFNLFGLDGGWDLDSLGLDALEISTSENDDDRSSWHLHDGYRGFDNIINCDGVLR